jgi:hypothetical protein
MTQQPEQDLILQAQTNQLVQRYLALRRQLVARLIAAQK